MDRERNYQTLISAVLGTLFPRTEFPIMGFANLFPLREEYQTPIRETHYSPKISDRPHNLPLPINHKVYGSSRRVTSS